MGFTFAQADAIALDDLLVHHLAIDQLEGLAGRAGVSLDARSHASDFLSLCVTGEGEIARSRFCAGPHRRLAVGELSDSISAGRIIGFSRISRALRATGSDVVRQQELRLRPLHSDVPKA